MKKGLLVQLMGLLVVIAVVFTSCGSKGDEKAASGNSAVEGSSTTNKEVKTEFKNNVEAFLNYVKVVDGEIQFWRTSDFAKFTVTLGKNYKNDIVNKYTGGKEFEIANRDPEYFTHIDTELDHSISINIVIIDSGFYSLKETDTKEVQYCCNAASKGGIISFLFYDGIYIYEVDEQGKKINEVSYFFKDNSK